MPREFDTTDFEDDSDGFLPLLKDEAPAPRKSKMAQTMNARRLAEEWWEARLLAEDEWDLGYRLRRRRRRRERSDD